MKHFRIHPAVFVSIHLINNTRKPVSLTAIGGTPRHYPRHQASLMRWHVFGSWAIPFFSLFPSLWYWVVFVLINVCCSRTYWRLFRCCLANSILIVLFLRLSNGFHLAGFSFFFHTSKLFFSTQVNLFLSSSTDVLSSRSFMVLLSLQVHAFILRIFQTVDLATPDVFAISPMGLVWFIFSLITPCCVKIDSSLDLTRKDSFDFWPASLMRE